MATAATLALTACGSSGSTNANSTGSPNGSSGGGSLQVLIASSGDAETNAVKAAVSAWGQQNNGQGSVLPATDIDQQLAQGFAGGKPADVFYQSTGTLAGYASAGDLLAYGDQLANKNDFYPNLNAAFTINGKLQCAPKDFSTLGLVINKQLWDAAGMTNADIPKTWDQLDTVAKKLTSGKVVGLEVIPQIERLGVFLAQNGGGLENAAGTQATANSPQNVQALQFVQKMLNDGSMKFTTDVGDSDGGQAIGLGHAVMTIEGNWIDGEMKTNYPKVKWMAAELPAGPTGKKGTLAFTNCWGIAAGSHNQAGALSLVKYLTTPAQQTKFADAFGVLPSVKSAAQAWAKKNPTFQPFIAGADYAQNLPSNQGAADVIKALDNQLPQLKSSDPTTILNTVQQQLQATIG